MWPEMGSVSVWEPFRVDPSYLGCSPGVAHLMSVGLFPEPLTKPAFSPQQQNWALPFHAAQTFAPAPAAAKGWHWEVGKVGSCSVLVLCSDEFWTQVDTTPAYGTASSQHKGLSRLLLASFLLTVPQTPCWRALVLNIWKLFSALQSCAALSIICLQISSLSCQGCGDMKDSQSGVGTSHGTAPASPFLISVHSGALPFFLLCSWSHAQDPLSLFSHVHSADHTRACTQTHTPTQSAVQKQDASSCFLSHACTLIAALHQPLRNLLRSLFQWARGPCSAIVPHSLYD